MLIGHDYSTYVGCWRMLYGLALRIYGLVMFISRRDFWVIASVAGAFEGSVLPEEIRPNALAKRIHSIAAVDISLIATVWQRQE